MNFFTRQAATFRNEISRSAAALLGIAQGMLADGHLNDQEILFLRDWLANNDSIAASFPGNVVFSKISEILIDGNITEDDRTHLTDVLQQMVGGTLMDLADARHVSELALDKVVAIEFNERVFCLTGDFVFGSKETCAAAITRRGGKISNSVTKKLHYLVVGGMGSIEWKHGSYGTKLEKAMEYKQHDGCQILIVHEDVWAGSLNLA